jgi:hypothetical protein
LFAHLVGITLLSMSTSEIAAAIISLPDSERRYLEGLLVAQRFGDENQLEQELAAAIAEADSSQDEGRSPQEVRSLIHTWSSESGSKSAP